MKLRAAALSACLVLVGAVAVARAQPLAARGDGRVLVMPFEGTGRDTRLYWLAEASAVLLSEDLAALGHDAMTRDERLRAFGELRLPVRASLSYATIIRIGELVGAADVVIGSLALDGDQLTVKARSVRLDAGRIRPEIEERGALTNLFAVFDRVAAGIAGGMTTPAGHTDKSHAPLPAFESYTKGLLAENPATQIAFLNTALALYAPYDAARTALWRVHTSQGEHAKAFAAVTAIPERSTLSRRARFLAALSQLRLKQYEDAFLRLKMLGDEEPAAAIANNLGVILLRRAGGLPQGRATSYFAEAAADRLDPDYAFNLGYAHWVERDPQGAIRWLRETVRLDPGDGDAHFVLGVALRASGAHVEGERELELARRLSSTYAELEKRASGATDPVPAGLERLQEDLDHGSRSLIEMTVAPAESREQRQLAAFHLDRGRRLYENEQDREAVVELRRSVYLAPYEAAPHLLLARIHLRARRVRDAIEAAKIAVWCEDSAAGHVVLGEAYLLAKDVPMARTEALRALALDPKSTEARKLLGKLPPAASSLQPVFLTSFRTDT